MEYYTWILSFHIISVLSWMAMLFYLPRLFVYHQEHKEKKEFVEVVKIQEYKMYKYIGNPAMWATILSGVALLALNIDILKSGGWMHAKIFVVVLMIGYSHSLGVYLKQLEEDRCKRTGRFFRAYNEVPTALAILIVTFVVVKSVSVVFTLLVLGLFGFIGYKIMTNKKNTQDAK